MLEGSLKAGQTRLWYADWNLNKQFWGTFATPCDSQFCWLG